MASTAWTARREDLVRELAASRAERDVAVAKAQAAQAELAAYKATKVRVNAQDRDHRRRREIAAAIQETAKALRLVETLPADPNAKKHRTDLLAALKEKP